MGSLDEFMSMATEARTQFYRDAHDKMGKALKAMSVETVSESTVEKEMESFIADGKFIDLEDMTKKYEEKPEQLRSIIKNTKTHFCKVRNVMLYEDPEYMSKKSSSLEKLDN